ncbi:MAG: hypothetical protein ACLPVY_09220, partial [Acidimicrobiia bacterium]
MPSPNNPDDMQRGLDGVSCPRTISCFAVGSTDTGTLVEHWNGQHWSTMPSPTPSRSTGSGFDSVACPLPKSCVAVGSAGNGADDKTLIERWDGHAWSIMSGPNRRHTTTDLLEGVSCPSPIRCVAVGLSDTGTFGATLVEYWNGLTWSIIDSPDRKGSYSALYAVNCSSTINCVSVGVAPGGQTFVARGFLPLGWRIEASPSPKPNGGHLDAIACPSLTNCFATGASQHGPLIEHGP